jgi:hypothetical protein
MPTTTALTEACDDKITIFCVAASTMPVRSKIFFDNNPVSNSMYSPLTGVAPSAIARLMFDVSDPLLQIDIDATVYVSAGHSYTVVNVAPLISLAANLPVAILYILHYDDKK